MVCLVSYQLDFHTLFVLYCFEIKWVLVNSISWNLGLNLVYIKCLDLIIKDNNHRTEAIDSNILYLKKNENLKIWNILR